MIDLLRRFTGRSLVRLLKTISTAHDAQQIHSLIAKLGFTPNIHVCTALLSLYASIGSLAAARQVFDEIPHPGIVTLTAMSRAYVISDSPKEAFKLFRAMRGSSLCPDPVALATVILACWQMGAFQTAKAIHGFVSKSGAEMDPFVSTELVKIYGDDGELPLAQILFDEMPEKTTVAWNSMIHLYTKHGYMEDALRLFNRMTTHDAASWNTMISGFCRSGRYGDGLSMFHEMENSTVKPNELTMKLVLSACSCMGALENSLWLHAYIERNSMNSNGSLDHCLIDMYAKCGSIENAMKVFDEMPMRNNLFSWTSAICGLAMHGMANHALSLFSQLRAVHLLPDDATMVGVLSACAHGGLVEQGSKYFQSMFDDFGIEPKIEHYGCMIDLYGRVGRLHDAYRFVLEMPMEPNSAIWGTLLSACRVHNDIKLGEIAAEKLIEIDPFDPWARIMLSNVYAREEDWGGVVRMRKGMKQSGLKKTPGCSLIEVNGEVHEFLAGGNMHPCNKEIFGILESFESQM